MIPRAPALVVLLLSLAASPVASTAGLPAPTSAPAVSPPPFEPWSPRLLVLEFAAPIEKFQFGDGGFSMTERVQTHLKAEMAMALAAEVTGTPRLARAARRDLDWVIRYRLEGNGGLNWDGPDAQYFFEVHQHWFLIASEMIREALSLGPQYQAEQRRVWDFLLGQNQAAADFYEDNHTRHGAFFGYRSVDRAGVFQSQAAFKGSYETGAALWSLALHSDSEWLDQSQQPGHTVSHYQTRLLEQSALHPDQHGFYDDSTGTWVRLLTWTGDGWQGFAGHDWKYALHMQEGALAQRWLTGDDALDEAIRQDLRYLLDRVFPRGEIFEMPDGYGTPRYEYGQALSVLGLAALVFADIDPALAEEALRKGRAVMGYVSRRFTPYSDEDSAILLLGLARVAQALDAADEPDLARMDTPPKTHAVDSAGENLFLAVQPSPSSGPVDLVYSVSGGPASIRIVDALGRIRFESPIVHSGDGALRSRRTSSFGRGELPSGRYWAILESGASREVRSFLILR